MAAARAPALAAGLLAAGILAGSANAQPWLRAEPAGTTHLLTASVESESSSGGSSLDRDTVVERVVALRDDGIELEYDLPGHPTEQDRAATWQLPARVLKMADGPLRLLDEDEMGKRVDAWLERARLPRSACGHWYFTWNAFQVDCDPQSALRAVRSFDLRPRDLGDGVAYTDPDATGPATLRRTASGPDGAVLVAVATVDPRVVQRAEAEGDVVAAEVSNRPLSLDDALRARSAEQVSGTVTITFETDAAGLVRKRTRLTRVEVSRPDRETDTVTTTETVERRPAPADDPPGAPR